MGTKKARRSRLASLVSICQYPAYVGCYEELGLGWYFSDCVIASFDGVRECSSDLVKHAVGYAEAPSVFVPGHVFLFCFGGKDNL